MKLVTREAKWGDFKTIKDIQREGYGVVNWGSLLMLTTKLRGGNITLIIDKGDKTLGYIEDLEDRKGKVHILNICFYPRYQGKGYGTVLIRKRINIYKKRGLSRVSLNARETNSYVREWYESLGFVEKRVVERYYREEDGIYYEKEL